MSSAYDADTIALAAGQRRCSLRARADATVALSRCLEAERPMMMRGFRDAVPPATVVVEAPWGEARRVA